MSADRLGWSWSGIAIRRPRLVVLVALVLVAISLFLVSTRLTIHTDTTDMISADVPFRQNDIAFKQSFPGFQNGLVAVIDGDAPERSEAAAAALAQALEADRRHFTNVDRPGSGPFFRENGLLYLETDELAALADRLAAAQPLLAALAEAPNLIGLADFVRLVLEQADEAAPTAELDLLLRRMAAVVDAAAAGEPAVLSWQRLLGEDLPMSGDRQLVLASPVLDYGSMAPAAPAIEALRTKAAELGIDPASGLRIRLTGAAAIENEELQSVSEGTLFAGILATLGVAALLFWGLRSIRLIAATLLTLSAGLIITAGLAQLIVGSLNLISVTFAVLFIGLGDDFANHVALRYREAVGSGLAHHMALRRTIAACWQPVSLSAVAAGLGFIAFAPTDYQGLAELGIISATGMVVAWAGSLTLLPALLDLMPLPQRTSPPPVEGSIQAWVETRRRPILAAALILVVLALPLLPRLSFDFNPMNLKDPGSEAVAAYNDLADDPGSSVSTIDLAADSLGAAASLAERLGTLPEVEDVVTLESFVPEDQEQKLEIIDSMAFFLGTLQPAAGAAPSPEERRAAFEDLGRSLEDAAASDGSPAAELGASLRRFAEATGAGDQALADLERRLTGYLPALLQRLEQSLAPSPIDLESLPDDLRRQWIASDGKARLMVRPAEPQIDNAALARFADAVLAVAPAATGTPVVVTEAGNAVVGAFIEASWIALALICLLLIVVLRSLVDLILVLVPVAVAVVYSGATAVLLGLQLNFANVIVLPLLLGLGVSGAIHVVMRRSLEADVGSTPRAVMCSALTTIASFGSLAVSSHLGLASMGLLLTIAILWSLVCSLVVLPALLAFRRPAGAAAP